MAQAQWQQVSPNFSRGITTAMSNAQQGIADVGKVAGDYLLRQDKLAQEETRKTERKQDVDFRQAQADQTQNNFLKSYALQGLSETRAAEEQAQKMATAEAQAKSSEYLNAARQNVVTPEQALKYSKTYDDMILKGRSAKEASAAMESLLKQDVQRYDASPVMQKQFIGNVNIDQGPMERSVKTIDPATGTVVDKVLQVNPDMKEAQARKDMILSGLDRTIADDKAAAERLKEFTMNYNINKAKLGEDRRHNKAMEGKENEFKPFVVTQKFPDGSTSKVNVADERQFATIVTKDPKTGEVSLKPDYVLGDLTVREPKGQKSKSVYKSEPSKATADEFNAVYKPDRSGKILQVADVIQRQLNIEPEEAAAIAKAAVKEGGTLGVFDNVRIDDVNRYLLKIGKIKDIPTEGILRAGQTREDLSGDASPKSNYGYVMPKGL